MHKFVTKCTMNTLLSTRKAFVFACTIKCKVCVYSLQLPIMKGIFEEFSPAHSHNAMVAGYCFVMFLLYSLIFVFISFRFISSPFFSSVHFSLLSLYIYCFFFL